MVCTNPQGQGHETVISQIVADELGIDPKDVTVSDVVDTHDRLYSITTGSFSSRFASQGTTAVVRATRQVKEKMLKIGAHLLEANVDDMVLQDGKIFVKGAPEKSIRLRHVAGVAHWDQSAMPEGMGAGLYGTALYSMPTSQPPDDLDRVNSSNTYGFVAEAIVVEVDPETGLVKILKWASMHDAGTIINPMIVDGQIHGGLSMGMAPCLLEEISYDENGNVQGGSFMDYLVPTAMETPSWETDKTVTPSPHHPFGAKGVGESATVGAPPAIVNAVVDALAHLGVTHVEIPMTPERVWRILKEKGVAE